VDPGQAVFDIETLEAYLNEPFTTDRFWLRTLAVFAILAIVLAAVGIYGLVAYSVAQRTHEIGLRRALGAQRTDVLAMVLRQGLVLSVGGVLAGVLGAIAASRLIASQLYGVEATDPVTFATVAVAVVAIALLATAIPARRATKVDPLLALRSE
jgi:putative ABC transport system permease protein